MGPNTGALAPRALPKSGLGVGCGRRSPPPAARVRGYYPRKIFFENSDAKSCILVTLLAVKFLALKKTTANKLGTNTLLVPNLKVGNQSPPVPTVAAPMPGVTADLAVFRLPSTSLPGKATGKTRQNQLGP